MGSWELASAHLMQENEWLRLYKQKNDKPFFIKGSHGGQPDNNLDPKSI